MSFLILTVALSTLSGAAQAVPNSAPTRSPKEIVDILWRRATEGEMLKADGWHRASGFYLHPTAFPGDRSIRVMSNHWGIEYSSVEENAAVVTVDCAEEGKIDSKMRFTSAPKSGTAKTGLIFHLVLAPTYSVMYAPDGKTVEKKTRGNQVWQISEAPAEAWTTVNTAIRFVLEVREKSNDPDIKKNADETVIRLLKLD